MSRYGADHQALRRRLLPYAIGRPCTRCGEPIRPGEPVDLDHADDGGGWLGFAHSPCNRAAGGRLGNARRRARRERITSMLTVCAVALEVSEDRRHTAVAAAGEHEGMVLVELACYLDGTAGALAALEELRASRTVVAVVVDPHSHASNLIRPLVDAGVPVTEPTSRDVAAAHGELLDMLAAGRLRHAGDPRLDAAVRHGAQRPLGGATTWQRRGLPVDVSPLTAATLAVWAWGQHDDYDVLQSVW